MIKKILRYTILAAMLLCAHTSKAYVPEDSDIFHKWLKKPSKELFEMGDKFLSPQDYKPDSAMISLTIVSRRYNKEMSTKEKQMCARAYFYMSFSYLTDFFDYTKAYECALKAEDICQDNNFTMPEVDWAFGLFYYMMAKIGNDNTLYDSAYEFVKKSFDDAINTDNCSYANIAFSNIVDLSSRLGKINELQKQYDIYKNFCNKNPSFKKFNLKFYDFEQALTLKEYKKAEQAADSLIILSKENGHYHEYTALKCKYKFYYETGRLDEAVNMLDQARKIIYKNNLKDAKIELSEEYVKCYKKKNDKVNEIKYRDEYLKLRDSAISFQQMTALGKISMESDIKQLEDDLSEMEYAEKRNTLIAINATIFLIVTLIFLILMIKKNRKLAETIKTLYKKNEQIMEADTNDPAMLFNTDNCDEEDDKKEENKEESEKYKLSNLKEEDKDALVNKILEIMKETEIICSLDFDMKRLAKLTNSQYPYVSQVINERYDCNFNSFLNKYRIREACRRFSDIDNYGNYTVEAISESVGFRSRTSFTSVFKKITGLTPSSYRKEAINASK